MASPKPHVLIIGAGLGGLTLAQALRKQGISFEVFEAAPEGRAQGWAIGIHRYFLPFPAGGHGQWLTVRHIAYSTRSSTPSPTTCRP